MVGANVGSHENLRVRGAYRCYIWGLRLAALGFILTALFGALGAAGLPKPVVLVAVLFGIGSAFIGIPIGGIGWLLLFKEGGIRYDHLPFIGMVFRDVLGFRRKERY